MNFPYNRNFVAQKLTEWQNFKDCPLLLMQLCAVQRISWKMCLGCGNMCLSVLKAQANMGEANLTCLGGCLCRISLCLDVQRFSKDVTECGDHVCQVKRTLTLWGRIGQSSRDGWLSVGGAVLVARTRKHHQTSPLSLESSKIWRRPHPKSEDDLTNEDTLNLMQKMKMSSHKK